MAVNFATGFAFSAGVDAIGSSYSADIDTNSL